MPAKSHGMAKTPIYALWRGMKTRCLNKHSQFYSEYGGRGITICERWINSFEAFYEDMGERPDGRSLERKDNDLGYCPENCVWATKKEQARNRRGRRMLRVGGDTKSMAEWAEIVSIPVTTLWQRCRLGWSDEDVVKTPLWGAGRGSGSTRHTAALRSVKLPAWQDEGGA